MKQVIVIRKDLGMRAGKMVAQGAHASRYAAKYSDNTGLWEEMGQPKIVVRVESEAELLALQQQCIEAVIPHGLVKDAGHTELEPGTITALAIGPDTAVRIDPITKHLKLL